MASQAVEPTRRRDTLDRTPSYEISDHEIPDYEIPDHTRRYDTPDYSTPDHKTRVRQAESKARSVDYTKGDFTTLRSALASVEQCQGLWDALKLDPAIRKSLSALFIEQKQRYQVIANLLDNLVSRYDRFLNLV